MATEGHAPPPDRFPEPIPRDVQAQDFLAALHGLWAGSVPEEEVAAQAKAMLIDGRLARKVRPLPQVPALPSEADLARIATDADPGCGGIAPELVLGPVADDPVSPYCLLVALALGAFFRCDDAIDAPYRRWHRIQPVPSREARRAVQAIAHAPLAPWRVEAIEGQFATLSDALGLAEAVQPKGPVRCRPIATPLGPPAPGDFLVTRIAHEGDEWVATCPLALPGPLPANTRRWIRWLAWEDRLTRRGPISLAGLLSRRGHALCRRLFEHAWAQSQ